MNPINKKIFFAALFSLFGAQIFYALSYINIFYTEINLNSFYGLSVCFILIFILSALLIFTYWNMDRLQKEPVYAIFKSYFSTLFIHSFLLILFNKAFSYIGGDCREIVSLVKFVLLPLFSLFLVFEFTIFRLPAFDESVDSLIYGGFVGVGLGSAMCIGELLIQDVVSLQYFIQFLIIRLLLCSSVCSLSGLLLNRLRTSSKISNLIFSIIILFAVFALHFILDSMIETNIKLSQIYNLNFIIPVVLSVIVFVITVIFISRKVNEDFQKNSKNGLVFFRVYGILIFLMIVFNCFYIQKQLNKTVKCYSADKAWSYELPKNFIEEKREGINSIFGKTSSQNYQKYNGKNCDFYISFNTSKNLIESLQNEQQIINGWTIQQRTQNQSVMYYLIKENNVVNIQFEYKNQKDSWNEKQLVKLIAKTLQKEVGYESK